MRRTLHCICRYTRRGRRDDHLNVRPAGLASESESAYKLLTGLRAQLPRVSPTAYDGKSMAVVTSVWRKQPGQRRHMKEATARPQPPLPSRVREVNNQCTTRYRRGHRLAPVRTNY